MNDLQWQSGRYNHGTALAQDLGYTLCICITTPVSISPSMARQFAAITGNPAAAMAGAGGRAVDHRPRCMGGYGAQCLSLCCRKLATSGCRY